MAISRRNGDLGLETKVAKTATPLADMMQNRVLSWVIAGALFLQIVLTRFGLPSWPCPFTVVAFPCPGCGLSRSAAAWLRGDWLLALSLHAFGPLFVLVAAFWGVSCILPARSHAKLVRVLKSAEAKFPIAGVFLGLLLIYWLARFVLDRERLFSLVSA